MSHRDQHRALALELLKQRRPYRSGSLDWQYHTTAAWMHLQIAMGKPSMLWTRTPPRVTLGAS